MNSGNDIWTWLLKCLVFLLLWIRLQAQEVSTQEPDNVTVSIDLKPYRDQWTQFKKQFDRVYSQAEDPRRFDIFVRNLEMIEDHNKQYLDGQTSYTMGIGPFTDQEEQDWAGKSCHMTQDGRNIPTRSAHRSGFFTNCQTFQPPANFQTPESIDWRDKDAVTPIRDQGQCGSCYAFGVTATVEAQLKQKSGKLVELSQQQLVDCTEHGCSGGNFLTSIQHLNRTGGLMTASDYPYKATADPACHFNSKVAVSVTGCLRSQDNECQLIDMVASGGPVYASINVQNSFLLYKTGVYSDPNCTTGTPNHCLTIVGYGKEEGHNGKNYWLVKNSWGTRWGESGFARIQRGVNMCKIGEDNWLPIIADQKTTSAPTKPSTARPTRRPSSGAAPLCPGAGFLLLDLCLLSFLY